MAAYAKFQPEFVFIVVVDRYSAYKSFARKHEGVKLAFCWAHVRREFIDAATAHKKLAGWADEWVRRINELFHRNAERITHQPSSDAFAEQDARLRKELAGIHDQA